MIYLDNAATTRLIETAFEAMRPFMMDQFANPAGTYSFASGAAQAVAACVPRYFCRRDSTSA